MGSIMLVGLCPRWLSLFSCRRDAHTCVILLFRETNWLCLGMLMLCATLKPSAARYNLPMHHFRVHTGVRRIACIHFPASPAVWLQMSLVVVATANGSFSQQWLVIKLPSVHWWGSHASFSFAGLKYNTVLFIPPPKQATAHGLVSAKENKTETTSIFRTNKWHHPLKATQPGEWSIVNKT